MTAHFHPFYELASGKSIQLDVTRIAFIREVDVAAQQSVPAGGKASQIVYASGFTVEVREDNGTIMNILAGLQP